MVRADSDEQFTYFLTAMTTLCGESHRFVGYFADNSLGFRDRWCHYLRGHIPHLDNNAYNRLEASWGAIKRVLSANMETDECINRLVSFQQSKENDDQIRLMKVD